MLLTVAAVARLATAIIGGLKFITPSKEEFKKTGQEIKHDFKNILDEAPAIQKKDSSIKKLFCDLGIKEEHKNFIKEYIVKGDGSKDQLRADDDKIEAFKKAVLIEKPGIDQEILNKIDKLVEKGKSTSDDYYGKFKEAISEVISTVGKERLESQEMKDIFKDKLNKTKQAKDEEKTAKKENSLSNKIKDKFSSLKRSSSHTENVEAGRRGSDNSLSRG